MNSVACKNSDGSVLSQQSHFRVLRNTSEAGGIGGGYTGNISQRSEIVQQFNYYKIFKEFRSKNRNASQSPSLAVQILQNHVFNRYLEIPTGRVIGKSPS